MKGFEKFILVIFSIIILLISVVMILVATEMITINEVLRVIQTWIVGNKLIVLLGSAIFALLGLIGMFTQSESSEPIRAGFAIGSEKGTVYITKDTFESIILSIARSYVELKNIRVEIDITAEGVIANIYAMILPDTVVPELTSKVQEKIKSSVLKQTTVEIKEANIKIKGVYVEPQRK